MRRRFLIGVKKKKKKEKKRIVNELKGKEKNMWEGTKGRARMARQVSVHI